MLRELTTELIISKDKVKDFIQSMTPKKKQSLDKQFMKAAKWKNAVERGEIARQLFAEDLGFDIVRVHTDLSRKEIKEKIEEIAQNNSHQNADRTLVVTVWIGHALRTDDTNSRKVFC